MTTLEPQDDDAWLAKHKEDDEALTIEQLRADLAPYPSYRQAVLQESIRYLEKLLNLPCTQLNPRLVEDLENHDA